MEKLYYDYSDLEKFMQTLTDDFGYDCVQTWEGCLGIGTWICLPTDDKHYHYIIHEEYANEWNSRHWMMKCRKLPKFWQNELDKFYTTENKNEL